MTVLQEQRETVVLGANKVGVHDAQGVYVLLKQSLLARKASGNAGSRPEDVVKALAMGAQAVMVGRPVLFGLANAGATGVAHVLRTLLDETQAAMALCGCAAVPAANQDLLHTP